VVGFHKHATHQALAAAGVRLLECDDTAARAMHKVGAMGHVSALDWCRHIHISHQATAAGRVRYWAWSVDWLLDRTVQSTACCLHTKGAAPVPATWLLLLNQLK
jgi:hypothetical protein